MLKKLRIILFLILLIAFAYVDVSAAALNIQKDDVLGKVTVSGKLDKAGAGRFVSIQIINPNRSTSELISDNPSSMNIVVNYTDQTVTNSDGEYSFTYSLRGDSGIYTVLVSTRTSVQPLSDAYWYSNPEDVKSAVSQINNCSTWEDIKSVLEKNNSINSSILELNLTLFNTVTSKQFVYQALVDSRPYSEENYTKIKETFNAYTALALINESTSISAVGEIIATQSSVLGCFKKPAVLTTYNDMSTAGKTELYTSLYKKNIQTIDGFNDLFESQVILCAVYKTDNWVKVNPILSRHAEKIGLNFYTYNLLKDKGAVDSKLAGNKYSSLLNLKTAFDQYTDQQHSKENNGSGSGSGTGGGGGGAGNGNVISTIIDNTEKPVLTDPEYNNPDVLNSDFDDLNDVPWAAEAIEKLAQKSIVTGKSLNIFSPNDNVTREEFVAILIRAFGLYNQNDDSNFIDIEKDHWSNCYIGTAQKLGLTSGIGDGFFGLGAPVTRQEMATFAYNTAKHCNISFDENTDTDFDDAEQIEEYAKTPIKAMKNAGIINGLDNQRFAPADLSTRAQAAKMVYGLLKFSNRID